jgi:hypothetical protein
LLRKKTAEYPEGRTSYKFKQALRKKVTIHGKSAFATSTTAPNPAPVSSELNLKETDDVSDEEQKCPSINRA